MTAALRRIRMRRRVWIAAGAALVLVVALVVTGVANADDSGNYRTATARTGDVASTLDAAGTVTPTSEADLSFPVAGQVSSVPVAVGQQVAAGTTLASLDTTSLDAAMAQARSTLATAQAKLDADRSGQSSAASGGSGSGAVPASFEGGPVVLPAVLTTDAPRADTFDVVPADLVVVGIGIDAAVDPLLAAGAEGSNGVVVELHGKTSLPDVYAIGDCAVHPNVHVGGRPLRLESIQNANDQAAVVAKSIAGTLGPAERYDAVPWFWSNQYDLRLQTVGLWLDHDEIVVRGDPATRSFSVVYLRRGRVIALDCVNLTKDYVQGKALITKQCEVDRTKLARADVPLKELA